MYTVVFRQQFRIELNLKLFVFEDRRKPKCLRRTSQGKGGNQKQTWAKYALAPLQRGSSLGRIGLRRMLSPLCHPCWPSELFPFCQSFSCLLEHIQQYSRSVWVFEMVRRKRAIVSVHTNWARILYRNETISEDLNQKWVNSNSWQIVSNV